MPSRLAIAFDVGAVYSRVSYCFLGSGPAPEVLEVTKFPVQGATRSDARVPSILYYDQSGAVRAVGTEVLTEDVMEVARAQGWTRAEWWKLHLAPSRCADVRVPPLPCGKSAVDILADFIKYLFDASRSHIREQHPMLRWTSIEPFIEYILTYPGGWGEQRHLYRLAIERAGLIPSSSLGRSRVHLLTEGEACLHFCVPRYLFRKTNHATAQSIVVIDAGGGTIDLNSFSMSSDKICSEVAPAECRLQGSIFVTQQANALLQRKLQGWEHSNVEDIARFTREFDQTTKLAIESDCETAYIRVAGRRTNNPRYCISSGQLKLSGEEATGLFDDSIDSIISAFEHQQKSATTPIDMVFLVGGLSTNEWLWSRLRSYFTTKGINICRPNIHIDKAVANGAILSYLVDKSSSVPRTLPVNLDSKQVFSPNSLRVSRPTRKFDFAEIFPLTGNPNNLVVPVVPDPTRKSALANARNLAVSIDGTCDTSGPKKTNVMKLFDVISNLGKHVRDAHEWLVENYKEGDEIYLFGFRGACHSRTPLVNMIHEVGLLRYEMKEQIEEVYCYYRDIDPDNPKTKESAREFKMRCCWSVVKTHFMGTWDSVSLSGDLGVKSMPEYSAEVNINNIKVGCPSVPVSDIKEVWLAGCHPDTHEPADVLESRQSGGLWRRKWVGCRWAQQEYVQFSTEEWKRCLCFILPKHKESPEFIQQATGISALESAVFCPGISRVREREAPFGFCIFAFRDLQRRHPLDSVERNRAPGHFPTGVRPLSWTYCL